MSTPGTWPNIFSSSIYCACMNSAEQSFWHWPQFTGVGNVDEPYQWIMKFKDIMLIFVN